MVTSNEALRMARRGRWAVAGMFLVNGFVVGSWAPQIPVLLARLGISEFVLGLLILGFGVGALVAMPWSGWLINRYGSRATTSAFAIAAPLSLVPVVAAPHVWPAAAALVVFGGLVGAMDIAMNANAVAVEKALGRAVMSSSHGFWSVGGFVGGGLGGLAIQSFGALPHAVLVSALALAGALLAMRHLVGGDRPEPGAHEPFRLPRGATVYIVGLAALFAMTSEGAVLDWAALFLQQERGASIAMAGFAFAAFSGAMALMRFLGDGVRNRFGAVRTLRVSSLVSAAGMLAAGLAPGTLVPIAGFAVAGLGIANIVPILFSAAGNQPGASTGAGMSVVTTMGYSGILVAPSAIGFFGGRFGFAPVYVAVAGLLVVVCLLGGAARAAERPATRIRHHD